MLYSLNAMPRAPRHRHRRHHSQRTFAVLLALAVLTCLALLPATATSSGSSSAKAAVVSGDAASTASVTAAAADNTSHADGASATGVTVSGGSATASSFVTDGTLTSTAKVTTGAVSLLGGIVTADQVSVSAVATATSSGVTATPTADVTNLHIQGVDGTPAPSVPVAVPGVGTLTIKSTETTTGAGAGSAHAVGLSLLVTTDTAGVAAGTVITVGDCTATADQATLTAITGTPTPTPTPSITTTPHPTRTPTPHPTHTVSPSPTASVRPTPSATYPAYVSPTTTYSPMPAPATPLPDILLRFPGAVFPVVGTYTYTDTFGAYRADMPSGHQGDDIFAAYGSPIVAVQDGTITGISTTTIGGNNIHLTTGRGDYFYYAHLSRFATGLQIGQVVVAGQTIGYVGNTGDAITTPSHLHFEIHPDGGAAVDPTPYLDAWRSAGHEVTPTKTSAQATIPGATPTPGAIATGPSSTSVDDGLQQVAASFAALQSHLTSGSREASGSALASTVGAVLLVVNTLGAIAIKRLQLGAALLP
ncbi:MAG TPA: M23 family metallopeptidase [Thermoleophilia bacterium]|nr:M23 family metallopeptidase [Thermoleophilia bacterium]